jgi:CDP-diacylglycerol--glycerol-3-phosphate 3-phosphatidyltransferase
MTLSVYQLKPRFQRLLQPLVQGLARARVTPNQLTVGTAGLMVAYGIVLALRPDSRGAWLGLVAVMPLRMALNALDGLLAQHTGRKTRLGAMLNEVCDVVSDLALTLPVALVAGVPPALAVLVACGAAVVEMTGLAALAVGSARRFDGPMGKSDRAVAYGLIGLLLGCGVGAGWVIGVLGAVALGLAATFVNRLRAGAAPPTP